jgi:membrane-bound ClpP family serine protease
MAMPTEPVTLSAEQVKELAQRLSTMRHDINNYLSLVLAGAELARYKPDLVKRMVETLSQQPPKIIEAITKFSDEFERTLGITRP